MSIENTMDDLSNKSQDASSKLESTPKALLFSPHRVQGNPALKELINNKNEGISKKINKNEYKLNLNSPVLLRSIKIRTQDEDTSLQNKIKVTASVPTNKRTQELRLDDSDGLVHVFTANCITDSITIKGSASGYFISKAEIESIEIIGYQPKDLKTIIESADYIEKCRTDISNSINEMVSQAETDLDRIELDIDENREELKELKKENDDLGAKIESLIEEKIRLSSNIKERKTEINSLDSEIKRKDSQILELESDIEDRKNQINELSSQSQLLKNEVKKLDEDKNIFAIELKDYITQGNSSKWQYFLLSIVPMAVIATICFMLFKNATNFLEDLETTRETWELLLSRAPYTLISFALITASYKICAYFIKELTHINNERLAMTKLQLIAKDVSDVSIDPDIDDPEIRQQLRAKLKMDVLKNYMRKEFTEDFSISHNEKPKKEKNIDNKKTEIEDEELVDDENTEEERVLKAEVK